jgi:myosin-crossreactive antigen
MILPMVKYLEGRGVQFHYNTKVMNVAFDIQPDKKLAKRIELLRGRRAGDSVDLTEDDISSSPTAATSKTPPSAARQARVFDKEIKRAAAGTCGAGSRPRTRPSAIPTSSAATRSSATG